MKKRHLIPNIIAEIEEVVKKENLILTKPVSQLAKETISDPTKHSFYTKAKNPQGDKLFLKVRIYNTLKEKTLIRHEIWMANFLRKTKNNLLRKITSSYLKTNINKIDWLIKKFDLGRFLGSRYELDKSLFTKKDLDSVVKILDLIQHIPPKIKERRIPSLEKWNFFKYKKEFFKEIKKYSSWLKKYIKSAKIEKVRELFVNSRNILDKYARVLAHGDFQPANFIKTKQGIKIIDWDLIHINNPLYDASYFWVHMWRRPKLRRFFIEQYLCKSRNKEAYRLFRLDSLYLIFIQLGSLVKYLKKRDVLRKKAFFTHLKSFDDLLNSKIL